MVAAPRRGPPVLFDRPSHRPSRRVLQRRWTSFGQRRRTPIHSRRLVRRSIRRPVRQCRQPIRRCQETLSDHSRRGRQRSCRPGWSVGQGAPAQRYRFDAEPSRPRQLPISGGRPDARRDRPTCRIGAQRDRTRPVSRPALAGPARQRARNAGRHHDDRHRRGRQDDEPTGG